jgi:two-component sensor histidine kinase
LKARPHPQQTERLNALYSYEVLDTDREKDFDEIVQLAAQICGTAISVINIIDADRQWFKAETGLGARETPLETSICSHIILEDDFVEIHDTMKDPRMVDNPLCCSDPGLRFYAGALLKTADGLPLGTLCVLDYEPRELSPLQRDAIRVLARQVMAQLELRRALKTEKLLRQEVDHRVKNSLQSVSAVIRLQRRNLETDEAREALDAVAGRIEAISMLHEHLYKSDAGAAVDLGRYLDHLGDHLQSIAPEGVEVRVDAEAARVSSGQAASVGTMVNELAANAFKHGFADRKGGLFKIALERTPGGAIEILCSDDGVGLPEGAQVSSGGLGMRIIELTSQQLGCPFELEKNGTGVAMRFEFTPDVV